MTQRTQTCDAEGAEQAVTKVLLWAVMAALVILAACSDQEPAREPTELAAPIAPSPTTAPAAPGEPPSLDPAPAPSPVRSSTILAEQRLPEPTILPTPEPQEPAAPATGTSVPNVYPPPMVGLDTGENTRFVDPELLAILIRHEAGDTNVPDRMRIFVPVTDFPSGQGDTRGTDPAGFIISRGGSREETEHLFTVPTGAIADLLRLPTVILAIREEALNEFQEPPSYPKMDENLSTVVRAYELGIPAGQAAQYVSFIRDDRIVLRVVSPAEADKQSVIAWLESEGVYVHEKEKRPSQSENIHWTYVALPVRLIRPTSRRPDVTWLKAEEFHSDFPSLQRHHWPREVLDYENAAVDLFLPEHQRISDKR